MINKVFSVRIPEDLYNTINEHCQQTGLSQAKFAIAAFEQALGIQSTEISSEAFNALMDRVEELEQRLGESKVA